MKIGIISDTHGCVSTWKKVYETYFSDADLIIHAGDVLYHGPRNTIPAEYNPKALAEEMNHCKIPIVAACGNCDAEIDSMVLETPIQSPYAHLFVNNQRIIVNHGHHLDDNQQAELANHFHAALFITGHTHVCSLRKDKNGVVYLNPGSPGMSKSADGHGTIAIVADNDVKIIDIETASVIAASVLGG